MIALLAGRAAEVIVYGEVSTGAADDLVKATDIGRQCVTRFGMDGSVGQAVSEGQKLQWLGDGEANSHPRDYSEATAREVDLAVRAMIAEAYAGAKKLLRARVADLRAGAKMLLEHETITPADFAPLQRLRSLEPCRWVSMRSNRFLIGQKAIEAILLAPERPETPSIIDTGFEIFAGATA